MKRREFVTFLAGAAVLPIVAQAHKPGRIYRLGELSLGPRNAPRYVAHRPVTASLTATLVFADGSPTLTFAEADAQTIGAWTNPNTGAVQTLKKLRSGEWTIYFRPEADGSRHEIVFEYGTLWGTFANKGAYTVTINGWGSAPIVVSVPQHWWRGRWRWQSAVRPFTANASDLLATKKLPPFGNSTIPLDSYSYTSPGYVPMGDAGVYKAMPDSGERFDIGLCTEHIARACFQMLGLTGGSNNAIQTMMDQAEAAGSIPWHFRDEATGRPIDFNVNPTWSINDNDIGQSYYIGPQNDNSGWLLNTPHAPCLSYVPYLLTGDLYHLEELQFLHTFDMLASRYDAGGVGTARLCGGYSEERGFAWQLRNIIYATYCTPTTDPTGCLKDKTYLTAILNNTHDYWYNAFTSSVEPWQSVFGFIYTTKFDVEGNGYYGDAPWEISYHLAAVLHAIDLGFTQFAATRDRDFNALIQFANGTSGWDRQTYPYYLLSNQGPGQGTVISSWAQESFYYQSLLSSGGVYPLTPNVYYQVAPIKKSGRGDGLCWVSARGVALGRTARLACW